MNSPDPLMPKSDVAQTLKCSARTLERLVRAGGFPPPLRHGKEALWFESVVQQWLQRQRQAQLAWAPAGQIQAPPSPPQHERSRLLAVVNVADLEPPAHTSTARPVPSMPAGIAIKRAGRPDRR